MFDNFEHILSSRYPGMYADSVRMGDKPNVLSFTAGGRDYIFKFHDRLMASNAHPLGKIYAACSAQGLTPRFIRSADGQPIIEVGGQYASLQERVAEAGSRISPRELGNRIGVLHRHLATLPFRDMRNHFQKTVRDMPDLADRYGYGALLPVVRQAETLIHSTGSQVIHSDLHPGNLLKTGQGIVFLDFDSACWASPLIDAAFAAFKFFHDRPGKIPGFLAGYNESPARGRLKPEEIYPVMVFNILQRILFIKIERDKGNDIHMWDLSNQESYLEKAVVLLKRNGAG